MNNDSVSSAAVSFGQQSIWLSQGMSSTQSAFNLLWSIQFRGPLNISQLSDALTKILARHDSLRSTFRWSSTGLERQIIAPWKLVLCAEDAHPPMNPSDPDPTMDTFARAYGALPYDLEQGPLFRFKLLRMQEHEHLLLCGFHHLIIDGTSWKLFVSELLAFLGNQQLPQPGATYTDYADWQQRQIDSEKWNHALKHWRTVAQASPAYELPGDGVRTPFLQYAGAQCVRTMPDALAVALNQTALALGFSPFRLAFAAFLAFLQALTQQEGLTVATTLVGRTDPACQDSIGLFVNTALMSMGKGAQASLCSLAAMVDVQLRDADEDYPYYLAIRHAGAGREPNRDPFTPVSFTRLPSSAIHHVVDVQIREQRIFLDVADRDVSVYMQNDCDAWRLTWIYRAGLFQASTIQRYAEQFEQLLGKALEAPHAPVRAFDLVLAAERRSLLQDWNQTDRVFPQARCLHVLVREQATRTPERIAISTPGRAYTYRQVMDSAFRVAACLRARGVGPGSFVPLVMTSSAELLIASLAVMQTGAAFSPLDPDWPWLRMRALLRQLGSNLVVLGTAADGLHLEQGYESILIADILAQPDTIRSDSGVQVSPATHTACSVAADPASDGSANTALANPLYCIFTSGSTGTPKGAINQHLGIVNRLCAMTELFGSAENDVILATSPATGDSLIWQYYWPLISGGQCVITPRQEVIDPEKIVHIFSQQTITFMDFVPAVFQLLVKYLTVHPEALPLFGALRRILIGGDILPVEAVKTFRTLLPHVAITNTYGPTETSIGVIFHDTGTGEVSYPAPIGRPIANVKAVIVDEDLRLRPLGSVGELCVGGHCVGLGYLNDPAMTRQKFVDNPFPELGCKTLYRTGDLARYRSDGVIECLGRIDHQINIRSIRIEPGEIEAALMRHPLIAEALVLLTGKTEDEKQLVAYVTSREAQFDLKQSQLRDFLLNELPHYMIPATFIQVASIALTAGGKINRAPTGLLNGRILSDKKSYVPPTHAFEQQIVSLWQSLLNQEVIGIHDHFFSELGADSLRAMLCVSRLTTMTGLKLSMRTLYECATPALLAERMRLDAASERKSGAAPDLDQVRDRDCDCDCDCDRDRDFDRDCDLNPANIDSILEQQRTFVSTWHGWQAWPDSFLFTLNAGGTRPGLFWCFQGYAELQQLAHALGPAQPVTGMRSGHLIMQYTDGNVEALASRYAHEMMQQQTSGVFLIGGNCQGARITRAIADVLTHAGRTVGLLILMEDDVLRAYEGQVALIFGRESQFNPFNDGANPEPLFRLRFPRGYTVDLIDGEHGEFFSASNVVSLATVLTTRLSCLF